MAFADLSPGARQPLPARRFRMTLAATLRRFIGMVLALAVFGLWLTPGANYSADVMLLKTGLTAILAFGAIATLLPRR